MNGLEKLMNDLNNLPEDYIILVETIPENAFELSTALVKYMTDRNNSKGIIVSANRPYTNLMDIYRKNDIDVSKMFVLDCISKNQNVEINANNVIFLDNVSSLTDISLSINERLNGSNEKKFIFFDSITTMLMHNKPYIFARFVHNVLTKMRLKGVGGILISLQDTGNKEIRAEIAQLCDKVLKI
jgi:hypothetical protein